MKLFKQLLVAPAALGLLAPVAAGATEVNVAGVSDYASVSADAVAAEQVTSITQFSDVYPTDWAYQALSNLIERYGCVAGYPNGTYRGNRAMTRFEAAALLNACLDRVTEVTDELKRLMLEFEKELAIVKGRVDGLEARVGELEATQFSTTTKLKGQATFVIGAPNASSSVESAADNYNENWGGTVFNYDARFFLDTSFTGKDLLRTMLRAGNFGGSVFFADGNVTGPSGIAVSTGLTGMETAFEGGGGKDVIHVNRLWYQFPIGSSFTATVGGVVRQDDMLAVWPSAYPSDTVLDFFTYAGAPGAYNLTLGAGAGLSWADNGWSVSANYVSANGNVSDPNKGGVATDGAASNGTVQLAYTADEWGIAAAYNYASGDNGVGLYQGNGTPLANQLYNGSDGGVTNSFGLSAYWSPSESGWIPSISTGWGLNSTTMKDNVTYDSASSQSWYVGLQWSDVFLKGNALGMAVGQPTFVTAIDYDADYKGSDYVGDGNYAWEWWYMFQVTDNISVTPALYYLSRPLGQKTVDLDGDRGDTFSNFGGLVKTTFRF
jgi:hypothetical protein